MAAARVVFLQARQGVTPLNPQWREFVRGRPGERFQARYERRRRAHSGVVRKTLLLGSGVLVCLIGVVFLAIPGPGLLVVFAGACLLADQSLRMARLLDRGEVLMRRLFAPR